MGVFVILVISAATLLADDEAPPPHLAAVYSLAEIRAGVASSRERLRSLMAEFNTTGRATEPGARQSDSVRNVVAARGIKRYHESAHFTANIPWELDPNRHQVYFTGKTLDVFYPVSRYYETSEKNATLNYSWKVRREFWWECLAWWPPDDDTRPFKKIPLFLLHEVLAQEGAKVRPRQEQVDGAWCHVVEVPDLDQIWLDPQIEFAMRLRKWSGGEPGTYRVWYEFSDYQEAAPRIWLPWTIHRVVHAPLKSNGGKQPILLDTDAKVVRVQVNDLPESLFQFTPPPGTLVQNRDTGDVIQTPGGLAFLDEVIEYAAKIVAFHEANADRAPVNSGSAVGYCFVGLILVLTALNLHQVRKMVMR